MNLRTRQRAMRALLGSLLQSELSISEIQEIAEEFYFGSLGSEFGGFLRNAMERLDDADRDRPKSLTEEPSVKALYEIINRRRLSKKEVMQLMTLAAPRIKSNVFSTNSSVTELLEKFVATATPSDVKSLFSILQGETADAYLKGITRRSREK